MPNKTICPIFSVSNVSGTGVDLLKSFISKLPNIEISNEEDKEISSGQYDEVIESEFVIDSTYNVKNTGFVIGGTVTKGEILLNQTLLLGPDKNGQFKAVLAKGIQENRVDIASAKKGQTVTINIKSMNKKEQNIKITGFKKGMSLVTINPKAQQ